MIMVVMLLTEFLLMALLVMVGGSDIEGCSSGSRDDECSIDHGGGHIGCGNSSDGGGVMTEML